MGIFLRERGGKRLFAVAFDENGVRITRTTDGLAFTIPESPYSFTAFLMACRQEQVHPGEQIKFLNVEVTAGGEDETKGTGVVFLKPGPMYRRIVQPRFLPHPGTTPVNRKVFSDGMVETPEIEEDFPNRYLVAELTLSVLSGPEVSPSTLDVHLLDVEEMVGALSGLVPPSRVVVAGQVLIENENGKIKFRISGSESADLSEKDRREMLSVLKRWLSGGYGRRWLGRRRLFLTNEFRSGTGISFTGPAKRSTNNDDKKVRRLPFNLAVLNVHGLEARLTFPDVAELYLVLRNMKGSEEAPSQGEQINGEKNEGTE